MDQNTRPDAYEMDFSGKENDIVKCSSCGFRCVLAQWKDTSRKNNNVMVCPSCNVEVDVATKGKSHKKIVA